MAVKAAYAQLQLAQFPYDAEAIQSADAAVVAELTRLSDTKRRFLKDPAGAARDAAAAGNTALSAHAEEQRHLLKTYQITARKLEAELRAKDADLDRAKGSLDADNISSFFFLLCLNQILWLILVLFYMQGTLNVSRLVKEKSLLC